MSVFSIAWDSICAHRHSFFVAVLMCTFAAFLSSVVIANAVSFSEKEKKYSDSVISDHEKTLLVKPLYPDTSSSFFDGWSRFLFEMNRVNECEQSGSFFRSVIYSEDENGIKPGTEKMVLLCIDEGICNLGKAFANGENSKLVSDGKSIPILAGHTYAKEYPVGSSFTCRGETYVVVGSLPKDAGWIPEEGISNNKDAYSVERCFVTFTDYLEAHPYYGLNGAYVILQDNANVENAKKLLKEHAKTCGIDISVQTIDSYLSGVIRAKQNSERDFLKELSVILLVCIITVSAGNIATIFLRKREIGILYACGYSRRDILMSLIAEAGFKAVICIVLWYMVSLLSARRGWYDVWAIASDSKGIFLILLICLVVVLFAVTTLCSGIYLVRKKPIEMLEDCG